VSDLDIRAIRVALAADAENATGVRRALSYVPLNIDARQLPLVIVGNPESVKYNRLFGSGHAVVTIRLTVLVSSALNPERSTELLDGFVSQELLALATELRQTQSTGQRPWTVNVSSADNFSKFQFESGEFYGVQLVVEVNT
jgi:hypothetical protein